MPPSRKRLTKFSPTWTTQVSPAPRTTKVSWNGRVKGKKVAEGDYLLRFYAESNPAYVRDVRVTVKEGARPVIPVAETGSIMPTWDMDDAAMWDMMMKPSVVVDIAAVSHQKVYDKPSTNGKALGTLHGQSQGIEVLKVEGGWAYIGAWQHESGGYIAVSYTHLTLPTT